MHPAALENAADMSHVVWQDFTSPWVMQTSKGEKGQREQNLSIKQQRTLPYPATCYAVQPLACIYDERRDSLPP